MHPPAAHIHESSGRRVITLVGSAAYALIYDACCDGAEEAGTKDGCQKSHED